ncbi:MAG: DegT/DnrJ/EryC1/StrS family aminotransferase [Anaerolineae bacterium]|nr:DegT/DnrJ/EryC1/StrS family aminotransferase [Promineifilum sp.]MCZ2112597.1 DegT/DnrJ/EryC1/StrS family aminotransferase [Anaerolineae bacterium]
MAEPIQLFVPTFRIEETLEQIRECLEKGWTGLGYKTLDLEQAWRDYTDLPHAYFLDSATSGLHLAVRLLKESDGWQDGDEVITTPLTFVSTNHAILYEGLTPVFADVDEYLCLSPQSVLERITPRTRAVMFVGMGGSAGRLEEVAQICRQKGLRLILDAAHMTGTRLHGKHVGAEADVSVFSFQAVKNMPTADSGMICFRDPKLDEEVRKWAWLGINKDTYSRTLGQGAYKWMYDVEHLGFKYHGNSIMAAMGLVSIKYVDQDNAYRRQLASWYDNLFAGDDLIATIPQPPDCESSRHLYQVMVDNRDEVVLALNAQQIYPGVHYMSNARYRMYAGNHDCPRATKASDMLISLPMHMRLSYSDVGRIADALRKATSMSQ